MKLTLISLMAITISFSLAASEETKVSMNDKADGFLGFTLLGTVFEVCDEITKSNKYSSAYADFSNANINQLLEGLEASKKLYNKEQTGLEFEKYYEKSAKDLKAQINLFDREQTIKKCGLSLNQIKIAPDLYRQDYEN